MTAVRAVVHFMQALLPEVLVIRYDQSTVVIPEALFLMTCFGQQVSAGQTNLGHA